MFQDTYLEDNEKIFLFNRNVTAIAIIYAPAILLDAINAAVCFY